MIRTAFFRSVFRPGEFLVLFLVYVLFCTPLQGAPLNIETRSYVHDPETGNFIYRNALFTWDDMTLEGTEILYNPVLNKATAKGYVRFKRDKVLVVMDRLEVDLGNNSGVFYNAILFDAQNRAYMTAEKVHWLGGSHFVLNQCSFTTCNPKEPAWKISGNRVDYLDENFSSSQHTVLRVQGVPVFYFPFLAWPTTTRRKSGFLAPRIEVNQSNAPKFDLGYRIGIPYFWAIDPEHDLTLQYEWVEKRGTGLHTEYQYAFQSGMFGQLEYRRYFERDPRDPQNEAGSLSPESITEQELRPVRFKFVYNHNQKLDEQSRLIVSSLSYSDGQFEREYERNRSPGLTAGKFSASVNRQFENGSMTLSVLRDERFQEEALLNRKTDNDNQTMVQNLPALDYQFSEIFWSFRKQSLTGSVSGSLIRYYSERGWNGVGGVSIPRFKYRFPLTPLAKGSLGIGRRLFHYQFWNTTEPGRDDYYSFGINEAQGELSTTISRQFVRESGIFTRLKHQIVPRLQYDLIEDVLQDTDSDVPFIGSVSTRRLATLRLENKLLAKRRHFERSVTFTGRSLNRLRHSRFGPALVRRLEEIQDRVYQSEKDLLDALEEVVGWRLNARERDELLAYAERGVLLPGGRITKRPSREGAAWTLARLDFVQHYDFLKKDPGFKSLGPDPKGDETAAGKPLLPLRMELKIHPGPNFSLGFFNRYDHLQRRIIEYSTRIQVGVSAYNKAMVHFRENETDYETPYGKSVSAGSTFGFGQNVEFNDRLAFGYSGTVDLDADSTTFDRRLSTATANVDYRPNCWSIRMTLEESRDKTTTSSGNEVEYVERTLLLNIKLGGVELPDQPLHKLVQ